MQLKRLNGTISGIGDSIFLGTLRVIAIGIGVSLLSQGNVVGAFLYALIFNIPNVLSRFLSARLGYRLGVDFLTKIQNSGIMEIVMTAAGILGMMGNRRNELFYGLYIADSSDWNR